MRAARKRCGAASKRGLSDEQVYVLVARDRTGQTLDFVTGKGPVTKAQLRTCLSPVQDDDVLLVSDANATYRYFAADAGITHESVNLSAGIRVNRAFHVQNVNAYHSRLHQWLARFHGVATRYLPNYLGWRRALDTCLVPCDHVPVRSWPLFHARKLMRAVIESFKHEMQS